MGLAESKIDIKELNKFKIKRDNFDFLYLVGKGGFAKVWKVALKGTNKHFAIKEMSKIKIIEKQNVQLIMCEVNIHSKLNNPFLANLICSFQDNDFLYVVMNFYPGGSLRDRLAKNSQFCENEAQFYIGCTILGLEYLHSENIIHRDIKPENLLIDADGYLVITDFGISRQYDGKTKCLSKSGTIGYMSPEALCGENQEFCSDYYSLGVIAYELLFGYKPYNVKEKEALKKLMKTQPISVSKEEVPCNYNTSIMFFINQLMEIKPNTRLGFYGINDIKEHLWFHNFNWEGLKNKTIKPPYMPNVNIDNFVKRYRLRNADHYDGNEMLKKYNNDANIILKYQAYFNGFEKFCSLRYFIDLCKKYGLNNFFIYKGRELDKINLKDNELDDSFGNYEINIKEEIEDKVKDEDKKDFRVDNYESNKKNIVYELKVNNKDNKEEKIDLNKQNSQREIKISSRNEFENKNITKKIENIKENNDLMQSNSNNKIIKESKPNEIKVEQNNYVKEYEESKKKETDKVKYKNKEDEKEKNIDKDKVTEKDKDKDKEVGKDKDIDKIKEKNNCNLKEDNEIKKAAEDGSQESIIRNKIKDKNLPNKLNEKKRKNKNDDINNLNFSRPVRNRNKQDKDIDVFEFISNNKPTSFIPKMNNSKFESNSYSTQMFSFSHFRNQNNQLVKMNSLVNPPKPQLKDIIDIIDNQKSKDIEHNNIEVIKENKKIENDKLNNTNINNFFPNILVPNLESNLKNYATNNVCIDKQQINGLTQSEQKLNVNLKIKEEDKKKFEPKIENQPCDEKNKDIGNIQEDKESNNKIEKEINKDYGIGLNKEAKNEMEQEYNEFVNELHKADLIESKDEQKKISNKNTITHSKGTMKHVFVGPYAHYDKLKKSVEMKDEADSTMKLINDSLVSGSKKLNGSISTATIVSHRNTSFTGKNNMTTIKCKFNKVPNNYYNNIYKYYIFNNNKLNLQRKHLNSQEKLDQSRTNNYSLMKDNSLCPSSCLNIKINNLNNNNIGNSNNYNVNTNMKTLKSKVSNITIKFTSAKKNDYYRNSELEVHSKFIKMKKNGNINEYIKLPRNNSNNLLCHNSSLPLIENNLNKSNANLSINKMLK